MPDVQEVAAAADRIEAELRTLGWWTAEPPEPERMNFQAAFGADTLAYSEWIQWVLLPRVRDGVAGGGLPTRSQVGVYAVREFDGVDDAWPLINVLGSLDDAINDG